MRRNRLTKQQRTLRSKQPENKIETEQEFKEDLKYRVEQDALPIVTGKQIGRAHV